MTSIFRIGLLLSLTIALGACATPGHRALDPDARTEIRKIGLLTPAIQDVVDVRMSVHPAASLGMVGMLIAEGDMSGKTGNFTQLVNSSGFSCPARFKHQLNLVLSEAGYEVLQKDVNRRSDELEFLSTDLYPVDDGSVDAYLDLYSDQIGYTAAGSGTPYRPTVALNVRLIRASDHQVIYQDRIVYNAFGDGDGAITLSPALGFEFSAFEKLVSDPEKALQGLQIAMQATGEELARQLR